MPLLNYPKNLTRKERKDLKILALFTAVFCADHHAGRRNPVADLPAELTSLSRFHCCVECADFLHYAIDRRLKCTLDPKPTCKHCQVHCYRSGHREKVRDIMRYSGKNLIRKGRLDLLWHYFF